MERKDRKDAYKHDWSGEFYDKPSSGFETVSVGVFQWKPRASGNGLKKGAVLLRIKGTDRKKIAEEAERICDLFDKGYWAVNRTYTVK